MENCHLINYLNIFRLYACILITNFPWNMCTHYSNFGVNKTEKKIDIIQDIITNVFESN